MEAEVKIDGRLVRFRATAAVPRLYRIKFRRDIMQDIQMVKKALDAQETLQKDLETGDLSTLPVEVLDLFESMAYIMAKHADPEGVPNTIDVWLDQFSTFSIYEIFPVISALWEGNMETLADAKKKLEQLTGK